MNQPILLIYENSRQLLCQLTMASLLSQVQGYIYLTAYTTQSERLYPGIGVMFYASIYIFALSYYR